MINVDIDIVQNETFSVQLIAKDENGIAINLSGYSVSGVAKHRYSSENTLFDLQPSIHPSYVSGIVDITVSGQVTKNLPVVQAVYDVFIYTDINNVTQILGGKLNIEPSVTRI